MSEPESILNHVRTMATASGRGIVTRAAVAGGLAFVTLGFLLSLWDGPFDPAKVGTLGEWASAAGTLLAFWAVFYIATAERRERELQEARAAVDQDLRGLDQLRQLVLSVSSKDDVDAAAGTIVNAAQHQHRILKSDAESQRLIRDWIVSVSAWGARRPDGVSALLAAIDDRVERLGIVRRTTSPTAMFALLDELHARD